jgi:1,4-dihydroxy-6-naphthoate synthase
MKLKLGFSPCPNDTFIFDAMVHGRIDNEGLEFAYSLADVEELNKRAFNGEADITKMSIKAFSHVSSDYRILDSGAAIGHHNGPLLISRKRLDINKLEQYRIAIPGLYTTANLLFSIAWPAASLKKEYLFSDIEKVLLNDEADAGLIIHETRFTYSRKGLLKLADLGEYWEKLSGLPIPLGVIAIHRRVPHETALKVNSLIRKSLEYAYHDSLASYDFVSANAREMDGEVMNKHIKLFVNKYTMNLGKEGKRAINEMLRIASEKGVIPVPGADVFLTGN